MQMPGQTTPFKKKRRGRPPSRPPGGDPDFLPNKYTPMKRTPGKSTDVATLTLQRRKQRIQEVRPIVELLLLDHTALFEISVVVIEGMTGE